MNITIDKRAEDHIKQNSKDNSIQITVMKVGGGWCSSSQPLVKMGKPLDENSFVHYVSGDINVYMPGRIRARNDKLSITFNKFLWMKSINVDGIIL